MLSAVFIYVLLDVDGRRRYVGKSVDPARRLKRHQRARTWAVSYAILEECNASNWRERERFWIACGRSQGWPLENIANGGDGLPEWYRPTAATRAKLATKTPWMKGKTHSLKTRMKMAAAHRGHSAWNKGLPTPAETRVKLSAAMAKRTFTDEHHVNLSIAARAREARMNRVPWNKGRVGKCSEQTRAKMSVAARVRCARAQWSGFDTTPTGYNIS